MPRLVRVLRMRELSAEEGVDQDVVCGKLSHLFSALPADVAAHKHEEAMHANGLCRVRVLQRLEERHLQDLGITLGDAIMILDELFEHDAGSECQQRRMVLQRRWMQRWRRVQCTGGSRKCGRSQSWGRQGTQI